MKKINKVIVPQGIMYMSEWASMTNGFQIPQGHCIINKILPGCGFTQYCITNNLPTILCSPRVVLLENKLAQNPGCFYAKGETVTSTREQRKIKKQFNGDPQKIYNFYFDKFKNELYSYLENDCIKTNTAPKILVTYDSLKKVIKALEEILPVLQSIYGNLLDFNSFSVVVDEFHLIFNDANFKAGVELNFLSYLQNFPNVCYVSATPVLAEYLEQIDEFKNLPYYELDWVNRATNARLIKIETTNLDQVIKNIIERYKAGDFEKRVLEIKDDFGNIIDQKVVESREVVFYVNSISSITAAIKNCKLTPDEVNIICSLATKENKDKINTCGKGFSIGSVPLQGQHHKMFTFCTSTAYCGVDFYSTCARTIILSDGDINTMAIDISLDIPQILGRQRLDCNPWKNEATFYYKIRDDERTQESFDKMVERKISNTKASISLFNKGNDQEKLVQLDLFSDVYRKFGYKKNYIGIVENSRGEKLPVLNKLVLLSDKRAFELQNLIYKSSFYVKAACDNYGFKDVIPSFSKYSEEYAKIDSLPQYEEQMKECCDYIKDNPEEKEDFLRSLHTKYSEPIIKLGIKFIESVTYKRTEILEKLYFYNTTDERNKLISSSFILEKWYSVSEIKDILQQIYEKLNYKRKKPVASLDLNDVFRLVPSRVLIDNKRVTGYVIKSLENNK